MFGCTTIKRSAIVLVVWIIVLGMGLWAQTDEELLQMSLEELMNVKITTAGRVPEKITDIPASVVLITKKDIETHGFRTLAEILESIPGLFSIDDYCDDGAKFGVRGFWSGVANNNMIIMVNGISQVSDFFSDYPLAKITIPVEAIDQIEVIRGPMSVVYGNGAFFGVINILTHDFPIDDRPTQERNFTNNRVAASLGSMDTQKLFFGSSGQQRSFSYSFNASLFDTGGIDQPLAKMIKDPSLLPAYGVPVDQRTGGRLENNEKYFNFSGKFKKFFVDLSYNDNDKDIYFFLPSFSDGSLGVYNQTNITFGYSNRLSNSIRVNGKVGYTQTRLWEDYNFFSNDFYGIQQFESRTWDLEINAFFEISDRIDIESGFSYRSIKQASNMYDIPSLDTPSLLNRYFYLSDGDSIDTRAIYAQVNYCPVDNLRIIAGARLEQMPKYGLEAILGGGTIYFQKVSNIYDQDEVEFIPRLAILYSPGEKHTFKFLYGQAIKRPSFFQNTQNLLLEPSRGPLQPENIRTLELNYIASFSPDYTLNISLFDNTLENLITRISELDQNGDYQTWSENAGKMVTQGLEITFNAEPVENLRLELSGTWQKTENKRPGWEDIAVAYSPETLGYLKASYRAQDFSISLTGSYVGPMETYWDDTMPDADGIVRRGNRIGERTGDYFLLGANFRLEDLFMDGLYLDIRCSNLLNEEIRYPTFTNNPWADRGTLGEGRVFLISLGIKF